MQHPPKRDIVVKAPAKTREREKRKERKEKARKSRNVKQRGMARRQQQGAWERAIGSKTQADTDNNSMFLVSSRDAPDKRSQRRERFIASKS